MRQRRPTGLSLLLGALTMAAARSAAPVDPATLLSAPEAPAVSPAPSGPAPSAADYARAARAARDRAAALTPATAAPVIPTDPRAPLAPVWTFPKEGRIGPVQSSPTVYRQVVYFGSDDAHLYAVHATGPEAGSPLPGFPIALDGAVKGRPAVYGNDGQERVYVATTNGSLYAFDLDGRPAWTRNPVAVTPGVPIVSTPAVRGSYVYVTSTNGRISRCRVADGSKAGGLTYGRTVSTRLTSRQPVPPARTYLEVQDARPFFPAGRITVITNDAVGGATLLEYTYAGKNTTAKPNRLLNVAPVGSGGELLAHAKGSLVVGYGPGAACSVSPAVPGQDEATVVIAALDGGSGSSRFTEADRNLVGLKSQPYGLVPQWEASYGAKVATAPVVDERTGRLFVGTWDAADSPEKGGRLYCLQSSNGQPVTGWQDGGSIALKGGALTAGPWFSRSANALYFGTSDGTLYGIDTTDGAPAFAPTRLDGAAGAFNGTPLLVNHHLYLGSHSGRFYAVPAKDAATWRVFEDADHQPLDTSPSASGNEPGRDVVVIGSSAGKVFAFPVE